RADPTAAYSATSTTGSGASTIPGPVSTGSSSTWTYLPPRSQEAAAAPSDIRAAETKTTVRPCSKGTAIRFGKNVLPVSTAAWSAGSAASTDAGSRDAIGL